MASNNNIQWVMTIGTWVIIAYGVSVLLPKFQRPVVATTPATAVVHPAMVTSSVANSPVAAAAATGSVRDFNLSGLAIEDLDGYPGPSGSVSISGI